MVEVGGTKGESQKVSVDANLSETLKSFAKEDGFDFSGISYVTEKDEKGKTKKDKDGKPIFVMVDGKPKTIAINESSAKVNSAVSQYVNIAVKKLIAEREALTKER